MSASEQSMSSPILEAALSYAQRGWQVFPLHGIVSGVCTCRNQNCEAPGKHPFTRQGWKDASSSIETVQLWFSDSRLNVAIATGEKSGLTVIDIDIYKEGAAETWAALNAEEGEPDTLIAKTGSGGLHIYFKYNSALETSANTLGPGIDCRNDGGYVVAPPSVNAKGPYHWISESTIRDLPQHLAKRPDKKKPRQKKGAKYTLKDIKEMLEFIPSDDRTLWRNVGIILGRYFERSETAWDLYIEWADKFGGEKGRNHDEIMREAFHELSAEEGDLTLGTIISKALECGWAPKSGSIPPENFLYYAPGNEYIYRPSREFWVATAVDACVSPVNFEGELILASTWIRVNALITSMTRDPNIPGEVLKEHDCHDGNLIPSKGGCLYNAYSPPIIQIGDPEKAQPWLDHVHKIFTKEGDADQFIDYMSHRVQFPGVKARFALVLVGEQGVGKDTAISMCGPAIGEWNIESIGPEIVESPYNDHCAKVLVIISEAASAQDMSKWSFNEKIKVLIAGTPDQMRINPKYGKKYAARMHCGVIITTNHLNGIYIPQDDRRYDVIQCPLKLELGWMDPAVRGKYFRDLWEWYNKQNGASHIAAFLSKRDLVKFDAATGQRITDAHAEIVAGGHDPDSWLSDAIIALGDPVVISSNSIWKAVKNNPDNQMALKDVRARMGHIMPRLGYARLVNKKARDGRWRISGGASTVFYNPSVITTENAIQYVLAGNVKNEAF